MWVAQYSFDASKALIGGLAVKNKVSLSVFPFYVQERGEEVRVSFFITFRKDKPTGFLRDLRKSKTLVSCSARGSTIFGQLIEPLGHNVFYDPQITHLKPWIVDGASGVETFTVVLAGAHEQSHRQPDKRPEVVGRRDEGARPQEAGNLHGLEGVGPRIHYGGYLPERRQGRCVRLNGGCGL